MGPYLPDSTKFPVAFHLSIEILVGKSGIPTLSPRSRDNDLTPQSLNFISSHDPNPFHQLQKLSIFASLVSGPEI
jgi:hypothetical protein